MSSLKAVEKKQFEDLFGMASGYVLDFTNTTFAGFFGEAVNADIYDDKYAIHGDSKAKRLRAFWDTEPDAVVGSVLSDLLEYWSYCNLEPSAADMKRAENCRHIAGRLLGTELTEGRSEKQFLGHDFGEVSLKNVNIEPSLLPILRYRLSEATRCLDSEAPLAVIFLCGSVLEGLLLGLACANPQQFNQAPNSPKDKAGNVKKLNNWTLAQFIDVSCELGYLKLDVKKFSHVLRDFRNYIHPYQQMSSGFNPDRHTAEICLQVLRAAIASISGVRT